MKVTKERGGWFVEASTSEEQARLEWLIECLQSHPSQKTETVAVEQGGFALRDRPMAEWQKR